MYMIYTYIMRGCVGVAGPVDIRSLILFSDINFFHSKPTRGEVRERHVSDRDIDTLFTTSSSRFVLFFFRPQRVSRLNEPQGWCDGTSGQCGRGWRRAIGNRECCTSRVTADCAFTRP